MACEGGRAMNAVASLITPADGEARRDAFAARFNTAMLGMADLLTLYIGDRLGLYAALAQHGALSAAELASQASVHERYAREWLEQQAVSGVLDVEGPEQAAHTRGFACRRGTPKFWSMPTV